MEKELICVIAADLIYYLYETALYTIRKLSVGFCPVCGKPIAEVYKTRFDGAAEREYFVGIEANNIVYDLQNEIDYSANECNYRKIKCKPYGWKYGLNKSVKIKGKESVKQYACDFYGNKEVIKTI